MLTQNTFVDIIRVPGAPDIPGLHFRGFQGESDYAHMVAVTNGSLETDRTDRIATIESTANYYNHLPNSDPYENLFFAEVAGQVIGFGHTQWFVEESGNVIYSSYGCVLPAWRRQGLGRAMLHYNENRLRRISAGHSRNGPRLLETFAFETEVELTALLRSEGYQPVVYFVKMVRPDLENIPAAPMPEGLEVRAVKPEHYRPIWEAQAEAMRDHWGYVPPTEEDYQRWLTNPITLQPELWKIAWDGEEVVGQVKSFINHEENEVYGRQRGYTEFISVRRPWRRRGLARSLLAQSLQTLKEHGMTEAALSVHTENPSGAFKLYESVGFRQTHLSVVYQKPMDG